MSDLSVVYFASSERMYNVFFPVNIVNEKWREHVMHTSSSDMVFLSQFLFIVAFEMSRFEWIFHAVSVIIAKVAYLIRKSRLTVSKCRTFIETASHQEKDFPFNVDHCLQEGWLALYLFLDQTPS